MRKLVKKYLGGGIASPSSIGQLILSKDLGIIQLLAALNLGKGILQPKLSAVGAKTSGGGSFGNILGIAGGAADALSSLIPQTSLSALTTGLNQGYDAAANALMSVPGWGTIAGGVMKVGGMLSDGLTALGVGTDLMTTTDKILDSKFLKLTPIGLVNAIGAKKADTMYKDNTTWELQGSAYGGSLAKVDDAMTKSGKKYGLFSGKGRREANRQIAEATRLLGVILGINDKALDSFLASSTMSDINNRRNQFNLLGGFSPLRIGQSGLKFPTKELIERAKKVSRRSNQTSVDSTTGAAPKITYESWYKMIPEDKRDTVNYNLRRAYELAPKEELINFVNNPESHLRTFYYNSEGIGEFMKSKNHPTLWMELEYYNNGNNVINKDGKNVIVPADKKEWEEFRNNYTLDTSGEYYKYVPKKFKNGGKMNVIPEGALHARLHHMDMEGITKKGIPVITKEDGGEIVLHAEIERDEIIFTKEVTEKLEELYKKGTDEAAIEAGKILTLEIMENTLDNTGLMQTIS